MLRSADEIVDWCGRLVRFPSPQTERMEQEPQVQRFIGECAAPLLDSLGIPGERDSMGNWIGSCGGAGSGPSLLLVAYAMTHPASSMPDAFVPALIDTPEGPALRGRGAAEQKGAMAAAFAAGEALAKGGRTGGRVTLAVSAAGETGRHDSVRAILSALDHKPDFAILALGTGGKLSLGNKGRIDLDIVVEGRSAHSSTPWLAVDAIAGARRVLDVLEALPLPATEHPALGRATLTPTFIESGPRATHTVQDRVRLTFDRRLLPGEAPEPGLEAIQAALAAIDGPWTIGVAPGPFMYPASIDMGSRLVTGILEAHRREGLEAPDTFYSHGALDAGYLLNEGIEAVMWGPGDMGLFHTDSERVPVAELVRCARGYLAAARALVGAA